MAEKKAEAATASNAGNINIVGNSLIVGCSLSSHSSLEISDRLTCARCGTWFRCDAAEHAQSLRERIRQLKLDLHSAVDLLGEVGGE